MYWEIVCAKKYLKKVEKKIIQKNAKRLYCLIIDFPKNKNEIIKRKKITKKKRKIEYTLFLIFKKWWITFIETSNKKQGMEIKQ